MPLLRKETFVRKKPDRDLNAEDKVFFCEATKEVFRDYEEFFERTILCNSLVWSCAITGKSGLTFEEAQDSEAAARKRLGTIPKPLKRGILWLADHTQRGRISDLVDDVYVFASARYFVGEIVEAIVNDQVRLHECQTFFGSNLVFMLFHEFLLNMRIYLVNT